MAIRHHWASTDEGWVCETQVSNEDGRILAITRVTLPFETAQDVEAALGPDIKAKLERDGEEYAKGVVEVARQVKVGKPLHITFKA